jgi:hypothetical protein
MARSVRAPHERPEIRLQSELVIASDVDSRTAKPMIRVTLEVWNSIGSPSPAVLTEESRYANEIQQSRRGGIEMSRQLSDPLAKPFELDDVRRHWNETRRDVHRRILQVNLRRLYTTFFDRLRRL